MMADSTGESLQSGIGQTDSLQGARNVAGATPPLASAWFPARVLARAKSNDTITYIQRPGEVIWQVSGEEVMRIPLP